ncbi:hypothetical protein H4R24_003115 [Coemansia sp. RSA 988]|nr:hypothetical protein H4R24_003115 [Coemansia sp. RSA 988]
MNTSNAPANGVRCATNVRYSHQETAPRTPVASSNLDKMGNNQVHRFSTDAPVDVGDMYAVPQDMVARGGYSMKSMVRGEAGPDTEFDYENAVRASYYGRRIYPSFDPANPRACPVQFIRQFEHAAHHNGLQLKAWARRLNSCLHGRAEDWAFGENPLEMTGTSWEVRKRQFLDWALLPAEQELRRQRLLRFYQAEADLSMDFVYTFEEAALGLREYREDVWVRKCIANLLPPIRTGLFELWPDGLPVRFRDLRDSLYAVDWSLYEAASVPLKVVRCGTPFVYETSGQASERQGRQQGASNRMSVCSAGPRSTGTSGSNAAHPQQTNVYSPPPPTPSILPTRRRRTAAGTFAAMQARGVASSPPITASHSPSGSSDSPSHKTTSTGIQELMSTLSRIPERERAMIMAALDKIAAGADDDSTQTAASAAADAAATNAVTSPQPLKPHTRLATVSLPPGLSTTASSSGGGTRAAAAVAAAAAAEQLVSMGASAQPVSNSNDARSNLHMPADVTQSHQSDSSATDGSDETEARTSATGTIRLRTRPVTAIVDARRRSSPLLDDDDEGHENSTAENVPVANQQDAPAGATSPGERPALARRLSSRKSDSALTSATRSMLVGRASDGRSGSRRSRGDSVGDALQSPEFTVLHPELNRSRNPHSRRERFANALLRLLR